MKRKGTVRLWAVVFWLLVWEAASRLINQRIFLVSPRDVILYLFIMVRTAGFWQSVFHSLMRIMGGYLAGVCAGAALAAGSAACRRLQELLAPLILTMKSVPVASFIILTLLFLPSRHLAVFISFVMVFPVIYTNVLEGIGAVGPRMPEMARLFRIPLLRRIRYIYLPEVFPYFTAGASTAMGFAWKSGIAAEVIGMPKGSIGERLQQAKIFLQTSELLSWTVVIVVLSLLCGKLFMLLLSFVKRRLTALDDTRLTRPGSGFEQEAAGNNTGRSIAAADSRTDNDIAAADSRTDNDIAAADGRTDNDIAAADGVLASGTEKVYAGEAIRIDGLVKRYGDYGEHVVFNNFCADIPKGSATAVMGPSGSGKTTLFRILAGLESPDGGTIHGLEGARISAVFQEDRLCEYMSAAGNIRLVQPAGLYRPRKARRFTSGFGASAADSGSSGSFAPGAGPCGFSAAGSGSSGSSAPGAGHSGFFVPDTGAALAAFGLPAAPAPVSSWSGGMKRRASLLRALLADWDVLFLDEPFKGLDEDTRATVIREVKKLTEGRTVILITHDPREAEMLGCSGIIRLASSNLTA